MALPRKDPDLISFGTNFSTRITASPSTFHLVAADATQYSGLLAPYVAAFNAMKTARDAGDRSESLTATKDQKKADFLSYARDLYTSVQADMLVSDANKIVLGINIRRPPARHPAPDVAPAIDIVSVVGHTVKIRVHDAIDPTRAKPAGVSGVAICSRVAPTPSFDPNDYKWEGNTGQSEIEIVFANSVAEGARVWITGMWTNSTQLRGPAADPVGANIQVGGMSSIG